MDHSQEVRARQLVAGLERVDLRCGLLAVQGSVVLRCPGARYTDEPMMTFDETDLRNAVALNLLEKRRVVGSYAWEWYQSRRKPPKPRDWVILLDGSRREIVQIEKGIAFYGVGANDLVPVENLIPASNAEPDCWQVDPGR